MASLAQYSAALHETAPHAATRPAPGAGTRAVGVAIYAAAVALVAFAGMVQATA